MSPMNKESGVGNSTAALRWSVVAGIAVVALLGSYWIASARTGAAQAATPAAPATAAAPAASGGCTCCGSATPAGPATTGQATTAGAVQKISVDVSKGYYDPSMIEL